MKRLIAFFATLALGTVIVLGQPSGNAGASALTNKTVCGKVVLGGSGVAGANVFLLGKFGGQGGTTTGAGGNWCASFVLNVDYGAQATYTPNCFTYKSNIVGTTVTSSTTSFPTMTLQPNGRVCSSTN